MDFDFSDDQEQLRDAVHKWVDKGYDFDRRRAIAASGGFDRAAYTELAELGLTGLYVSEAQGGMGMGPVEGMVVMEALGRGIVMEPLTQTLITSAVLEGYGPDGLKTAWLGRIASGEALVVLAHQERKGRYNLSHCATLAKEATDAWSLTGVKHMVPAGAYADAYLVPAMIGDSLGLFLVERNASGLRTAAYATQDSAAAADIHLDNTPAQLLSRDGLTALEHAVDIGIASLCAEAVGVMDKTMAITIEYMNTRKQFNTVISSFQALRHRVADMKMQLELARSMSFYASLKLNAPTDERRSAMARAKYQLGVSMRFVGQQAVQLHGGIGVTDEYIVSHYFKKLTQLEMTWGDTLHQLGEVSERMQDTAGVFA